MTHTTDLTELTVSLIPDAVMALEDTAFLTGDTWTDTVNRALQVYAKVCDTAEIHGGRFLIADHRGNLVRITVRPLRRVTTTFGLAIAVTLSLLIALAVLALALVTS